MEIREIEIPVTNQIYLVAKAKRFFVHFNIHFKRKSSVNTKKVLHLRFVSFEIWKIN